MIHCACRAWICSLFHSSCRIGICHSSPFLSSGCFRSADTRRSDCFRVWTGFRSTVYVSRFLRFPGRVWSKSWVKAKVPVSCPQIFNVPNSFNWENGGVHVTEMLVLWKAEVVSAFPTNISLSFGQLSHEGLSGIRTLNNLQKHTFHIAEVNQKLIWAHFDDMVLNTKHFTCLSCVFSEILMKVPELLPQSLIE